MGVRLAHARAKDPRWLTTLSGSPPPPFDDGLDLPWCALCLRRDNDEEFGESLTLRDTKACASGTHAFCSSCRDVCGGELLCEDKRCPLCRLCANSNGLNAFNSIVRESESLKLPKPSPAYAGPRRLMLRDTVNDEDRCEITVAVAADRCAVLRESMRPKPRGGGDEPDGTPRRASEDAPPPYDPSDVARVVRAFVEALPEQRDLPEGLCENMAIVSNSSALLGLRLGEAIDAHKSVVRFNEYARAGLTRFERDVGQRTTLHVVSEQVIGEFMEDAAMLEALRSTPVTLWMPPLAWGNARSYSRYVRLLLNREESDGLSLTAAQRRKVVTLRPSVSFSVWKYFRPNAGADGGGASEGSESDDAGPFSERSNTHDRPTTATTGFKFFLLAMGLCDDVSLFGFEDDPRNAADSRGGHFFNPKHSQEDAYDIAWERREMRRYEARDCVRLVPSHR